MGTLTSGATAASGFATAANPMLGLLLKILGLAGAGYGGEHRRELLLLRQPCK